MFTLQSPSGPTQWVVLADYKASEAGMLSVSEGELVVLLDTSTNAWGLVKPVARPSVDGWVPMAYISPYSRAGNHNQTPSLRYGSMSSSEESDTPPDILELGVGGVVSPEVLEMYENEEQRASAEEKRT